MKNVYTNDEMTVFRLDYSAFLATFKSKLTRKPCYRKENRAMLV